MTLYNFISRMICSSGYGFATRPTLTITKLALAASLLVALMTTTSVAAESDNSDSDRLTVRVPIEHAPPYRNLNTDPYSGFHIGIFNALAEEMDWDVNYIKVPYRRALLMMEKGNADIMIGLDRTAEREQYMAFVVPAFPPERSLFLYNKPENRIYDYGDLRDKKIGVLRGKTYFSPFENDLDLLKESATDYETPLKMLARDYVDTVIIPELLSIELQRELNLNFKVSPFFVPGEETWIAIAQKSRLLPQRIKLRRAFNEFVASEEYEKLFLEYLNRRPTQDYDYPTSNSKRPPMPTKGSSR